MTIGELEQAAGITDREAFWMPFAKITGTTKRGHMLVSNSLEAGVAELRRLAAEREQT